MVIQWNRRARQELRDIYSYHLSVAGKQVAQHIQNKIIDVVSSLANQPHMGHVMDKIEGLDERFRSLVINKHYKVIYFIDNCMIVIFSIWDTRQNPVKLESTLKVGR